MFLKLLCISLKYSGLNLSFLLSFPEIISTLLLVAGAIMLFLAPRKKQISSSQSSAKQIMSEHKSYDIEIPHGASQQIDSPYVNPREVIGTLGNSVIWQNNDGELHSVTSGRRRIISKDNDVEEGVPDGLFDITLKPRENFSFRFMKEGTYHYYCKIHKCSEATIVIK